MSRPTVLLLTTAALLGACGDGRLVIEHVQQGTAPTTSYGFAHENWQQEDVKLLREREGLDLLRAAAGGNDWALQLALCRWTRAQFQPGFPDPYPRANGVAILDDIRAGRTSGFCGQYAYLFADALKSVGLFDVRYLELESASGAAHSTTEVWSDHWQRWIALDPYANAWYSLADGVPLSALEIHGQLVAGTADSIVSHVLEEHEGLPTTAKMVAFYHRVAVSLRNDLADGATPPTIGDRRRGYLMQRCHDPLGLEEVDYLHGSSRSADFTSSRNQTFIDCEPLALERNVFSCLVSTRGTVAHLARLLMTLDGETWTETGSAVRWSPRQGEALSAVAVSDLGWLSRTATVRAVAP